MHEDAIKILRYREHLSDLPAALALIGFHLAPEHNDVERDELADDVAEMLRRLRVRGLLAAYRRDHLNDGPDPPHDWPAGDRRAGWIWGSGSPPPRTEAGDYENTRAFIPSVKAAADRPAPAPRVIRRTPLEPEIVAVGAASPLAEDEALTGPLTDDELRQLMRRTVEVNELDVVRAVNKLARLEPLTTLPLLKRTRTARHVQLVYDIGLFPGPFGPDLRHLIDRVRAAADGAWVEEIAFRHRLSVGCGTGPVWTWRPYRVPSDAVAVIFASGNFGADPAARHAELSSAMAALHRRGQRVSGIWYGNPPDVSASRRPQWTVITE